MLTSVVDSRHNCTGSDAANPLTQAQSIYPGSENGLKLTTDATDDNSIKNSTHSLRRTGEADAFDDIFSLGVQCFTVAFIQIHHY